MLLNISQQSAETLQEQIIGQIRARILSGQLAANEALPSIRGLSHDLRVGINTVQRAYEQLLREELIYARKGKGFFVCPLEETDKTQLARQRFQESLYGLMEAAMRDGLEVKDLKQIFNRLQSEVDDGNA